MFYKSNKKLNGYKISLHFKEDIEPDEILIDASNKAGFDSNLNEGKLELPIKKRNFYTFLLVCLSVFLLFTIRLGQLQLVRGEYYFNEAKYNKYKIISLPALRGVIYDRNGFILAENQPSFDVILSKFAVKDNFGLDEIAKKISKILDIPESVLISEINEEESDIFIISNVGYGKAIAIEEFFAGSDIVRIQDNIVRKYNDGKIFSHIIGYIGKISQKDLSRGYLFTDYIGKSGVELFYENLLKGVSGYKEILRADKNGKSEVVAKNFQSGKDLVLTIDAEFQKKIYDLLNQTAQNNEAAAVFINPSNGEILASISLPSYDNNLFSKGILKKDYQKLISDKSYPFLNRVLSGEYPPGSTVKPFIAAAALEENIISPDKKISDNGSIVIPNPYYPDQPSIFPDWKAHGLISLREAIAESCDVYFYTIGGGYGDIKGLGIDRIKKYLNFFGLGEFTGVDLNSEANGLVPNKDWKEKNKPYDSVWRLGDTYHASIGQGDVLATPLQIANAIAAIANGGTLYEPHLLKSIKRENEIQPKIIRENFIDEDNLKIVQEGMRMTVTDGSARSLSVLPVEVAGKTGTAQFGPDKKLHSWFVGFAPYKNPQVAFAVLVEGGGEGSSVSAPIAKEALEWYFSRENNK